MEYYINSTSVLGKKVLLQLNVYTQQLNLMAYEYLYLDLYEILPKEIHYYRNKTWQLFSRYVASYNGKIKTKNFFASLNLKENI